MNTTSHQTTDQLHLRPLTDYLMTGPALADRRHRLDFEEFRAAVSAAALRLNQLGVGRGDTVATVLANRVELIVTMYAAWTLGAALTPVNPALTEDEIAYQLSDAAVRVAVVDGTSAPKMPHEIQLLQADSLLAGPTDLAPLLAPNPSPSDLALIIYTSGTTGRPKGVTLDHRNIAAMTAILHQHFQITEKDRSLLILPLFHVNGIMISVVSPLSAGGSAMLGDRFDPETFWTAVRDEKPTFFSGVPAIFNRLTNLPADVQPYTCSLRFAMCGAAPMPAQAITKFEARYQVPVSEGYGLSETTVALTINPLGAHRRPGTVGVPLPGLQIRVVDETGLDRPDGLDGEVLACGPTLMRGYLGRPAETAAAFRDGWLCTGDVGHLDDGYLVLVDRKKDLIIRGGENIAPSEIEAVIAGHPDVAEVAVVGRPHPDLGEEPVAFVATRTGQPADADDLLRFTARVLAKFKLPRAFISIDRLPRNAVGKVDKTLLRKQAGL
jgi:acyl-CoA synthetase (AMP-forming)/AMP-acid ligase II